LTPVEVSILCRVPSVWVILYTIMDDVMTTETQRHYKSSRWRKSSTSLAYNECKQMLKQLGAHAWTVVTKCTERMHQFCRSPRNDVKVVSIIKRKASGKKYEKRGFK
jgi:ribosomal protein L16 Arg81 hydroxylase